MLHVAVGRFIQNTCPGRIFAGCDATTGFETRHATSYYARRCSLRHAYTKVSAGSDMKTQLVCAVVVRHHPVGHEIKHFPRLFEQMVAVIPMHALVLDKGYDAEWVHQMIRRENIASMIPARGKNLASGTRGHYRKLMRREFLMNRCTTNETRQMLYEIFSISYDISLLLGLRVEGLLPHTRALDRLTQSERKTKYHKDDDGEWEHSAESGNLIKREVII